MKDLGIKVVCLNSRVRKLERKLDLTPIVFQPKFSSGYENLLVNQVIQLNTRVVRLEKNIVIDLNKNQTNKAQLKNISMKINNLCQRINKLEKLI